MVFVVTITFGCLGLHVLGAGPDRLQGVEHGVRWACRRSVKGLVMGCLVSICCHPYRAIRTLYAHPVPALSTGAPWSLLGDFKGVTAHKPLESKMLSARVR